MDPFLVGLLGLICLFVLLALGTHIGIALAISGFLGIWFVVGFEQAISMTATSMYHKISSPALITLPLFILMGYCASGGGISRDLFDSLSLWLGRFKSGIGIATVIACTAFGTVCGSAVVTAAVFAKICAPEMRRHGYSKELAYAICASAGCIGMLIPPSILAIVYAMLSGVSTGKVLMAGVVPGLMWCVLFSITIILIGKKRRMFSSESSISTVTWRQKIASIKVWWPIAVVAGAMFGGIYGGVFSPSEAAAFASFVLLIIYLSKNVLLKWHLERSKNLGEVYTMFTDTATTSALIFLIMGAATVFSNFIVLTGMATRLSGLIYSWGLSKLALVALFAFVYLILGCLLDSISMLCITIPVFNPIIEAAGIDPIWYAVIVITSVHIGLITPPVGLTLYAAKGVAEPDVSLEDIVRGILPFFIAEMISLVALFAWPGLSTFLPSLVG